MIQCVVGLEYSRNIDTGTSNPAMVNDDGTVDQLRANSIDPQEDNVEDKDDDDDDETKSSGCLPEFQFSMIDSEYDETLAFPDSVTILSNVGDKPVLVERKEMDDEEADGPEIISEIPFLSLYGQSIKFNSFQRKIFIPGVEVKVQIVDTERSVTTHFLSPNLYTIELTHGPFTWTIKKRYKHFNSLHQQLMVFRASLNIPFPIRSHKEKRATMRTVAIQMDEQSSQNTESKSTDEAISGATNQEIVPTTTVVKKNKKKRKLPRFPNRPESLVTAESMETRKQQLEEYLSNLLNISLYRCHHETLNFVEVSNVSFVSGLGIKGKEGEILKRTGSTRPGQAGCDCFGCFQHKCCIRCNYFCSDVLCGKWRKRWFFVKETYFGYLRPSDGEIRAVILFDQGFDVSTGIYQTGMRRGLQILTNNRHIVLKCWTRRKTKDWLTFLKQTANQYARDFTCPNPHFSYAPVRNSTQASWFVDGSSYMSAVADALEGATTEIYIADWWLSPEIYMKRPAIDGDYWRLDKILHRKATEGVKVFVLLYKEVEMALGINSFYSKQRLNSHENIKVMRHPDHARVGVFLWAHHEKIVVVDQTYAFLGGIDLCYGRWDDFRHRLTDLGSISKSSVSGSLPKKSFFNDDDSAFGSRKSSRNVNIDMQEHEKDIVLRVLSPTPSDKVVVKEYAMAGEPLEETLKLNTPELERKNVLGKFKESAVKKGKEFVNRLTLTDGVQKDLSEGEKVPDSKDLTFSAAELDEGEKGNFEDYTPFQTQILGQYYGNAKFWFGKDYANFIMKDFVNLDAPFVDLVDRTTTPRMPWHDVGIMVTESSARDVARHFIQRWNAQKLEKVRENNTFPYLIPMSYSSFKVNPSIIKSKPNTVTCQLLRSVSSWSCGFIEPDLVEQSIHDAYIQTITKAQHYIYIENQFFISLQLGVSGASNNNIRNQISETLFKRIVRAHKEQKTFRVIVVIPLLPGFEGDVGGSTGIAVRALTHWNYASISRGRASILTRLKEVGVDNPHEYISFHSLRTHSELNNIPITELIYVHSKLLIADDRVVICGSANINDRSMIGKRDSEIAAIITDNEFEDGRMNGEQLPSGIFAGRLRKYLFKEHLGLLEPDPNGPRIDVTDPVIDQFYNGIWRRTSKRNTDTYDEVFKCVPNNLVKSFSSFRKYNEQPPMSKTDPEMAANMVKNIQGFLVDLPTDFLSQEVLTPPNASKEGIVPTAVWT
ncbi:phospholipase D2 isoform X2 [Eupeodes corollae]|uniref:phospholipase D2 isoform X2 n=1 Tax=Eupeodes corollae TaxID=290404 RepID=UPI002492AFA7|nr:phospholipase D2 isoform X2 [Eupeodes corollae]